MQGIDLHDEPLQHLGFHQIVHQYDGVKVLTSAFVP